MLEENVPNLLILMEFMWKTGTDNSNHQYSNMFVNRIWLLH